MNILITGGVGFIGTNTALFFGKNKRNKIVLVDDFSRPGVEINAKYLIKTLRNLKIIRSNVNQVERYLAYLKNSDVIIHLAGQTAVTTSIDNPTLDFASNLQGGFALLEAVRVHNPKAIILYSSTNKVYGNMHNHQIKKNDKTFQYEDLCHSRGIDEKEQLDFISPYGCSKGALDCYFQDYHRIYGLNTVVLRQSCIYGPFQIGVEDQGWVAHFAKQFLKKKPITIFGDGYQVRDLLHVNDLILAYGSAIQNIRKAKGEAFNIGGGMKNTHSLLQVVSLLKNITKTSVPLSHQPSRLGDQNYFVSSNIKAKKILGWRPTIGFEKGILDLIRWQQNNLAI